VIHKQLQYEATAFRVRNNMNLYKAIW